MLSGVPSWLLVLFDRLKQITGRERIADIWPRLRLVIHGGTKFEPYRALFQQEIGSAASVSSKRIPRRKVSSPRKTRDTNCCG